jgi:uncharacterized membrane protein
VARRGLIGRVIVLLAAVALVGVILFLLGLMGVAEPPRQVDEEAKPSPLIIIGLIMIVLGSLIAYATHLISRE